MDIPTPTLRRVNMLNASREEEVRRVEEEIRRAAKRIDPRTALMVWCFAKVVDPYGLCREEEIPPEYQCVGREYFLVDLKVSEKAVLVGEVRAEHPEIPDEEWDELMVIAAERDHTEDPFPFFHSYRRRGSRSG
jgi:hypothetical protein